MTPSGHPPSREEVLDAFAVEPNPGRATLERYLREYPQYATELVDLSRELSRVVVEDEDPPSAEDQAWVDAAWQRHLAAAPKVDPLAALSVDDLREIARRLDVPRQVLTAFRERRVDVASVPRRFLARFAESANSTLELFVGALMQPAASAMGRSYKADQRPGSDGPVAFERLLIEAGVPEDKRARLLADGD